MSQASPAIAAASGVAVRTAIAAALAAIVSGHGGAARPAYAGDGTIWIKTVSASLWEINLVQGGADVVLASFNPATGALTSRALAANVSASVEAFRYDAASGVFSLAGDIDTGLTRPTSNQLAFVTAGVEAMRVDHFSRVLIGGPSTQGYGVQNLKLQIQTLGSDGLSIQNYSADAGPPAIHLYKSRAAAIGGQAIVQDGDSLGQIAWIGSDGAQGRRAANIEAFVDGAPGIGDMPGRLAFSTTSDGAASVIERLRIDSAGNIVPGASGLATNAVAGFLWIESGAGAPTGVPAPAYSNRVPLYYDRTNNRLHAWNGAWRSTPLA